MILEIPDGYFVNNCDLDADEPWCEICPETYALSTPQKLPIPKALAYYLKTHFCGSESMEKKIIERTRREIASDILMALGIDALKVERRESDR